MSQRIMAVRPEETKKGSNVASANPMNEARLTEPCWSGVDRMEKKGRFVSDEKSDPGLGSRGSGDFGGLPEPNSPSSLSGLCHMIGFS